MKTTLQAVYHWCFLRYENFSVALLLFFVLIFFLLEAINWLAILVY